MKNLARLFFVLCFSFSAMAQNPPSGVYKYAFYAPLPNGTFVPISLNTANALLTAAGSGNTNTSQPPSGMYKAAVYGMKPDGTFVPISLDSTGALMVSGGGGGAVMPSPTTIVYDYDLHDGSGTVVTDVSGNNNNGTLQTTGCFGTPPTWNVNHSINFTGGGGTPSTPYCGIATPVAESAIKTVMMCGAFGVGYGFAAQQAVVGNTLAVGKAVNLGSSLLNTPTVTTVYGSAAGTFFGGALEPMGGGPGCLTVVYNTVASGILDQIYWNGVLLDYKTAGHGSSFWPNPTSSAGIGETGNIVIGADGFVPAGRYATQMRATLGRSTTWSNQLTAAAVNQAYQAWLSSNATNGTVIAPIPEGYTNATTPLSTANFNLAVLGNSITAGYLAATSYSTYAAANFLSAIGTTVIAVNRAVSDEISGDGAKREGVAYFPQIGIGPWIATDFEGTNDSTSCRLAGISAAPTAYTIANITTKAQAAHTAGYRFFEGTMISRSNIAGCDAAWKDVLDPAIRQLLSQGVIDGIFDFESDPLFGADGASAVITGTACGGAPCFQTDQIHPTTTGQQRLAQWYANFILANVLGSSSINPDLLAGTTYSMLPQNKYVIATPTIAAAWNFPDCIALTGLKDPTYRISNTSAFAITMSAVNSETITGSPIIAAGVSAIYTPIFGGNATAGCSWLRTQ